MRFQSKWVLVLVVSAAICVSGWATFAQRQGVGSNQWEYTVKHTGSSMENATAVLNELGSQGWELVNVTHEGWAYFKRPRS